MFLEEEKIINFSMECLKKVNIKEKDARIITETMLVADYRQIHSHGFLRLPIYIERIKKKFINVNPDIKNIQNNSSLSLMDGDYGPGQIVGTEAMKNSILKAKQNKLGLTIVKNSNHFGIAAYYASLAAKENMIGITISNSEPLMPAIGGAEKIIGNNPIAIAAPTKNMPVLLDMALSNVPLGKILAAKSNGISVPKGWGVDKYGEETTNPDKIIDDGFLSPMAGPKGFGLALLTEIITGVISGGQYSKNIPLMYDLQDKQSLSHFMLALDPSFFMSFDDYLTRVEDLISIIKKSKKSSNEEDLFIPGEIEFLKEKTNQNKGVPMNDNLIDELNKLAQSLELKIRL